MLVYIFRPRYPSLHWRPRTTVDLLNRKLVSIWKATETDTEVLNLNLKGYE